MPCRGGETAVHTHDAFHAPDQAHGNVDPSGFPDTPGQGRDALGDRHVYGLDRRREEDVDDVTTDLVSEFVVRTKEDLRRSPRLTTPSGTPPELTTGSRLTCRRAIDGLCRALRFHPTN